MATQRTSNKPSIRIGPQKGFQEKVLACTADICVCGGSAGPGKTWALLMDAARHHKKPGWRALILRRTSPEITNPGAMWDESFKLYPKMGGKAADLTWRWGKESSIKFGHCQHEKDRFDYDGAQAAFLGIDQAEHFTSTIFWHLWSRLRTTCGVNPYLRATANPVPEDDAIGGWLHKLIQWWIDKDTGLIIPERDGVIRWFYRNEGDDGIVWASSKAELLQLCPGMAEKDAISFTFIEGKLAENVILKKEDPKYESKLRALPKVERERLLKGNWNVRPSAGNVFNRAWFTIVPMAPVDTQWVRYWDKAGTEEKENPNAAHTAGVLMGFSPSTKGFYVGDCTTGQWQAHAREKVIRQKADIDGTGVTVYVEQEPGSGGKESAYNTIVHTLTGFACFADRVKGDKYVRSQPYAAMVQAQNVYLVAGDWNEGYLNELHAFEPEGTGRKDRVDASSGAYNKLTKGRPMDILGAKPLTEAEEQAKKDEAAELARQHVIQTGCVFPGEW